MHLGTAVLAASAVILAAVGCEEEEPEPEVVTKAPAPPPAPPEPKVTPVEDLMAQYNIDPRVRMTEDQAPDTDAARIALLKFYDAFARGNNQALSEMLSPPDQYELKNLVDTGQWSEVTDGIDQIQIQTGRSPAGDSATMGIFYVGMTFQPQLWSYTVEDRFESAEFSAEPTPPEIMQKLHGTDFISLWYQINAKEMAKANEPDVEITKPQQDFSGDVAPVRGASGGGSPGGPGPNAPGKRRPPKKPIPPPSLPGGPGR